MKKLLYALLRFALLMISIFYGYCFPETKMTNLDVIKMVRAKMSAEIIISTINNSEHDFDLSTDALIKLKTEGVPDSVIQVMIAPQPHSSSNQPQLQQPPWATATFPVNYIDGANRVELKYKMPDYRTNSPFSFSGKVRQVLQGSRAEFRIQKASPEFEITLPGDVQPSNMVILIKFDVKSDRREIVNTSSGPFTAVKTGFPQDHIIPIKISEATPKSKHSFTEGKLYKINVNEPLSTDEYALIVNSIGFTYFYDFGVD